MLAVAAVHQKRQQIVLQTNADAGMSAASDITFIAPKIDDLVLATGSV